MNEKRILSLDVSTKTGYALLISRDEGFELETVGQITQIHQPDGPYPVSFIDWSYECYGEIEDLIDRLAPDCLVIEETSAGSKSVYSQKILEFIHFLLAKYIKQTGISVIYVMSEVWRRGTGCKMSKEESIHNKQVRTYKEKNNTKVAYGETGKRIGILTRKHVNVRRANEIFDLKLKIGQNDAADAVLLAYYCHIKRYEK